MARRTERFEVDWEDDLEAVCLSEERGPGRRLYEKLGFAYAEPA